MKPLNMMVVSATVLTLVAVAAKSAEPAYDRPVSMDLTFVYHLDADMPEQDVFIEKTPGSGEVFRVSKADRDFGRPIFAVADTVPHSPFDPKAGGPYPKGANLGLTLGEWLGASGRGTYTCDNGTATLDVMFDGLVPDGVYSLWHFFMAMPPTVPFIGTYDLPAGSRDGSESVFSSDAAGSAHVQKSFQPCLQLSGEQLMAGLAVAWHSDGQTYGPEPGDFGLNSHVQLFLGLPLRAGL